jgi:hypothetical protein
MQKNITKNMINGTSASSTISPKDTLIFFAGSGFVSGIGTIWSAISHDSGAESKFMFTGAVSVAFGIAAAVATEIAARKLLRDGK